MKYTNNILLIVFLSLYGFSHAQSQPRGKIPPLKNSTYYSASSTLPASYGISYEPSLAGDRSLQSWWSPSSRDREKCWLQLNFSSIEKINTILIHAGSHYPSFQNMGDLYEKNLRIRVAQLEFSDGSEEMIFLEDVDRLQSISFPSKYTSFVRIRPLRYYPSSKWNDPCISHFTATYDR